MTYEIVELPHEPQAIQSHVDKYKAFRLFSLQESPEAFGSTYAREIAFADDIWVQRLSNPLATTFVARKSGAIASTLTILGPIYEDPGKLPPSWNPWTAVAVEQASQGPVLYFQINGMFTHPEARGQGLASRLIEEAFSFSRARAVSLGKEFAVNISVKSANTAAKTLYEKCGFKIVREEVHSDADPSVILLMTYRLSELSTGG
ncbi:hypothetical protein F5884DRAFT_821670 [Xylogone sp. PMI_703]|nr:hypothetical protein F5884DRAFT_821670 [Xylogone sp. PMI_703]